ncbi:MAG: D,D-dipeptide ABC transporter permease, partial [Alphaproteobacteria bacterium]|nr:D,D-dipeptide ABC transporter permease [Alphaproteobacteria bacterium]
MISVIRRFLRDRAALLGTIIIALLIVCAIFAPWLSPHPNDIYDFHTANRLKPPSWNNPFGTDR